MKKAQLFTVFAAFLLIVFGFQNCSAPLPEEESDLASSGASGNFSFNTRIDQIAYMSCPSLGPSYDKSSYFTFRVGAFNPGSGVGIDFDRMPEIVGRSVADAKAEIVGRKSNSGAMPVLAIRNAGNAQSLLTYSSPQSEVDYSRMLGVLTDDYIIDEVLKDTSQRVRYKRNGLPEGGRVEGHLNLGTDNAKQDDIQLKLKSGNYLLAINYPVRTTEASSIRAPAFYNPQMNQATANSQVIGTGFKLDFKRVHSGTTYPSLVTWALNSVGEENMEMPPGGRTVSSGFSCPDSLVFKIVNRRDLSTTATAADTTKINCAQKADDPDSLGATDRELLRRARLSLRVEDWYIDMANKCIVAKKYGSGVPHCYGSKPHPIQYDLSKSCHADPSDAAPALQRCAALASICIR